MNQPIGSTTNFKIGGAVFDEASIRAEERQKVLSEVEGWLVDENNRQIYNGREGQEIYDIVYTHKLRAKLAELKGEK